MACACPVICDNRVGTEVVGEAGIYADVTKPKQIAAALEMIADPGLRVEHASRGVERVKMFTWEGMAKTVVETIRKAAA